MLETLRLRFIKGLVEIIKYTYEGFCEIIFMSLVCVDLIDNTAVWFYDAKRVCLETWQFGMIGFGVVFAVPFPLALLLAMKNLEQGKISSLTFFMTCFFPLPGVLLMLIFKRCCKSPQNPRTSRTAAEILYTLQGPFRKDPGHITTYWEVIISIRRLLITGIFIIGYSITGLHSIQLSLICCLCVSFLIHHIYVTPFQVKASNHVESLSLSLLLLFAIINLMKALLFDYGFIPIGPIASFFKILENIENIFIIILLIVIIIIEINKKMKKKPKRQ